MSFYQRGLTAGEIAIPHQLQTIGNRLVDTRDGYRFVRLGEKRFYHRGLTVGAATSGPVGTMVDGLIALTMDIAHVLLLLAGMWLLWKGLLG